MKLMPILDELHERLAGVVIARLRWANLMRDTIGRQRCSTSICRTGAGEADYGEDMFDRVE